MMISKPNIILSQALVGSGNGTRNSVDLFQHFTYWTEPASVTRGASKKTDIDPEYLNVLWQQQIAVQKTSEKLTSSSLERLDWELVSNPEDIRSALYA
jgi:hypothetical protein